METEGKKILVNYLTDIADTFRSITGETDTISAESFSKEVQAVATPSSKNSYQRNSIEEMNAITDAKDGDTCLCYYTNSFNITEDRAVGVITFPKKVVFENAITEYYNARIEATDSSVELWGMIDLSPNDFMFRVDKMDDQSRANAFYSSEDGITYTLNQPPDVEGSFELVNERTVDFKINIVIQNTNEHIGAFLIGTDQVFDGLYKYDGNWKILSLNYPLNDYNVEVSKIYYNNGEQEGMLGNTETKEGLLKVESFINKYGINAHYPKDMKEYFRYRQEEKIPLLELNPNTGDVINMAGMFGNCENLKTIPLLDTRNVTNMAGMFSFCRNLKTIPKINTAKVTDMSTMFSVCKNLEEIPLLDTSNVTNMHEMFGNCELLRTIPELNTVSVSSMPSMFINCSSIKDIPLLEASSVTNVWQIFDGCELLENLGGLKNLGQAYSTTMTANDGWYSLVLSKCPLLTHDSLMNVINNLYDIKSKGVKPQTLQLGDTNKAKLTAEEIAIATNKGWNVI
jgi:surface protein